MPETCENCGRTIGKLETAHVIDSHVVCRNCVPHIGPRQVEPLEYGGGPAINPPPIADRTVLIELTSKKWKKIKLLGALLVFGGGAIAYSGADKPIIPLIIAGLICGTTGIVIVAYGWIGSWWEHE